jgi:hypothetical protein
MNFYAKTLNRLRHSGHLLSNDKILILAGGNYDRQVFLENNFKNVTISNLDYHCGHDDYSPYEWKKLDAESIAEEAISYDWVIIHAGLHHLAVPALGVCEMLRVARKGILCIESRDSIFMKLAIYLGLTSEYELEPVYLSGGQFGGYRYGPIPNYVYRWTEREFEKTVNSFIPTHKHTFFYYYGYSVPVERFSMAKNPLYKIIGIGLAKIVNFLEVLIPKQGNKFAFAVLKQTQKNPWLTSDLSFDQTYLSKKYDKQKYKGETKPII